MKPFILYYSLMFRSFDVQYTIIICNFFFPQIGTDDDVVTMLKNHVVMQYQWQKVSPFLSLQVLFLFCLDDCPDSEVCL
jgi:hypothetical protein